MLGAALAQAPRSQHGMAHGTPDSSGLRLPRGNFDASKLGDRTSAFLLKFGFLDHRSFSSHVSP